MEFPNLMVDGWPCYWILCVTRIGGEWVMVWHLTTPGGWSLADAARVGTQN